MKKILALIVAIGLLVISFSGCNHADTSLPNGESSEQNQSTEPNPASDFEYEINSSQTGILINKYIGSSEHVIIPSHIADLPVVSLMGVPDEQYPTAIAEGAFEIHFKILSFEFWLYFAAARVL